MLSESLRSLRTNIQFASMDRKVKSLVFTSAGLGEGKSTVVVNLAVTLAMKGSASCLSIPIYDARSSISGWVSNGNPGSLTLWPGVSPGETRSGP